MAKLTPKQKQIIRECGVRDDGWKPPAMGYGKPIEGLVALGLMQEVGICAMPPFKLYNLTAKGHELRSSLIKA